MKSAVDFKFLAKMLKTRVNVFNEIPPQIDFIDCLPFYDLNLFNNKKMKTTLESSLDVLQKLLPLFENLSSFEFAVLHNAVFDLVKQLGLKNGQVLWPLRTALSGKQFTPGGGLELACLLGKKKSIERTKIATERLSKGS